LLEKNTNVTWKGLQKKKKKKKKKKKVEMWRVSLSRVCCSVQQTTFPLFLSETRSDLSFIYLFSQHLRSFMTDTQFSSTLKDRNLEKETELLNSDEVPLDAKIMVLIIKSMGVEDYEPRVINLLLEFMHRMVSLSSRKIKIKIQKIDMFSKSKILVLFWFVKVMFLKCFRMLSCSVNMLINRQSIFQTFNLRYNLDLHIHSHNHQLVRLT
jgi:hypothetical protein